MRRTWLYCIIIALLAACSPAASPPTVTPAPTAGPSATPLRAPRNYYIPTEFDKIYYATDLNLVDATGRPQFINAYADWCRECQRNRPTVHQLQDKYGEAVDFLHVDVDNPGALDAIEALGLTGQTQYVLIDGTGTILYRWYGIIDAAEAETLFEDLLDEV